MRRANDNEPIPTANDPRPSRTCPICGKVAVEKFRPFCSKRCADVDLHRWLGGTYAIRSDQPAGPADDPE